jgi:hypothetical protein
MGRGRSQEARVCTGGDARPLRRAADAGVGARGGEGAVGKVDRRAGTRVPIPQEQGRSGRRRSTCRGRDDGHGLALRHGLPLTESVLRAAAAAR